MDVPPLPCPRGTGQHRVMGYTSTPSPHQDLLVPLPIPQLERARSQSILSGSTLLLFSWPVMVSEGQLLGRSVSIFRQGLTLCTDLSQDSSQRSKAGYIMCSVTQTMIRGRTPQHGVRSSCLTCSSTPGLRVRSQEHWGFWTSREP